MRVRLAPAECPEAGHDNLDRPYSGKQNASDGRSRGDAIALRWKSEPMACGPSVPNARDCRAGERLRRTQPHERRRGNVQPRPGHAYRAAARDSAVKPIYNRRCKAGGRWRDAGGAPGRLGWIPAGTGCDLDWHARRRKTARATNAEAGSSGKRHFRTAQHGQRVLQGKEPHERRLDDLPRDARRVSAQAGDAGDPAGTSARRYDARTHRQAGRDAARDQPSRLLAAAVKPAPSRWRRRSSQYDRKLQRP